MEKILRKNIDYIHIKQERNSMTSRKIQIMAMLMYGMASDSIHSDWGEIRQIYLNKTPDKKYAVMIGDMPSGHYRSLIPVAVMLIDSCKHYVNWEQGYEPNKVFIPLLDELRRVCELIMAS